MKNKSQSPEFFKFPSTPHLALPEGVRIRSDKVLTDKERREFLKNEVIVEEKIDGANLGISFCENDDMLLQARGKYLKMPGSGQWKKLPDWISSRKSLLHQNLWDQFILFGEWCYAQHSISYDRLPDWFLAFDIYDRQACNFLSTQQRNRMLKAMSLEPVPFLARGRFSLADLEKMINKSRLSDEPAEGIYLRYDRANLLGGRAKLVRPNFIQSMESHWSKRPITPNSLASNHALSLRR
ncbi:MAG: RNA ligase family protein [Aminivibrio sp.]|jgi:ATP-dependent RNA circularization protein (DNA/RNA ligase family)